MKKIILASLVATVAAMGTTYAQSYAPDAFRFSQTNYGSSARFRGMGGAQIGVGGDIGSINANPAGLGLFTKSEFSITPEFNSVSNGSAYLGNNTSTNKNQLNLNNVGVVFYSPATKIKGTNVDKGLVSSVFGLSYTRNNDFLNNFSYSGTNTNSSIRDSYVDQANNYGTSNSIAGDAYNSYLINKNTPTYPNQFSAEPYNNANFKQNWDESRLGSTSEFNVAGALNFGNKVYIGATASFVNVKYTSDATFTESGIVNSYDDGAAIPKYNGNENYNLTHFRNQETKGGGFNLKLGAIFRPVSELRIGLNFQTPTWMNIEDNTNETLQATTSGNATTSPTKSNNPTQYYSFTYNLRTPLKASAGISYVIAGTALISADVDYVDYSSMRFSDSNGSDRSIINDNNAFIKNNYKETVNYRVGAEVKVTNELSLRAGYGVNGNGIKGGDNKFYQGEYYTGGIGYRIDNYYFDVAYQNYQTNFNSSPYLLNDYSEPVADIKSKRNNVFLTFGVRF
ncbi:OmpP1/FadL family transporter [Pedobacter vanadiisoli]|uniref:OmpP1/FadL family transporter n=1 Tax=Pedobacter vanadiisoli TaxID=1761975 RepID=A0ABW5MEE4_9SPHI